MELLEIDGVDLRVQGFGAATRTGRYSLPPRRGENTVLPGSSGATFVRNKPFEEGVGALALWAIGATTDPYTGAMVVPDTFQGQRQALEDNIATFMRLFTRGHRLSTIRAAQPDGTTRRALVEWKEWTEPETMAGGTRAEWAIAYVIPGVWWEDEVESTSQTTASATLPKTLDLYEFTDMTGVIDDAVFTVDGPITNPRITDMETGAYVEYQGSVNSSSSWVVNVAEMTSKVGSGSVMANTRHAGGYKLLTIPNCFELTNTPRLQLSGSGGGTTTRLTVTARRKWVNG